jgi:hypothetical protein
MQNLLSYSFLVKLWSMTVKMIIYLFQVEYLLIYLYELVHFRIK